jgi:hypothetical protein
VESIYHEQLLYPSACSRTSFRRPGIQASKSCILQQELQRTNDFVSNTTASMTQGAPIATTTTYSDADWSRLHGYTEVKDKKVLTSYVYSFGYRVHDAQRKSTRSTGSVVKMTKNTLNWSDTTCLIVYLMLYTTISYPLP